MAISILNIRWRLTLLGRSLLLLTSELLANAICWLAAGLLFARHAETRGLLSLSLLAWTIGLRHALDADHISAIDNATRGLIGMGQLPVTCGLFFSLGHSTIVIAVNVAIAVSVDVYNRIGGVGDVGGIVGTAVSASVLFLLGVANSAILYNILRNRRRRRKMEERRARGSGKALDDELRTKEVEENMAMERKAERSIMMRILGPITKFVDRPWKMYPVGVLFGFGFDTASSIALLAISMIAKRSSAGDDTNQGDVVILPFLFTAGMSLVDSIDSVLMLYAYAGAPDRASRALFVRKLEHTLTSSATTEAQIRVSGGGPDSDHGVEGRAEKAGMELSSKDGPQVEGKTPTHSGGDNVDVAVACINTEGVQATKSASTEGTPRVDIEAQTGRSKNDIKGNDNDDKDDGLNSKEEISTVDDDNAAERARPAMRTKEHTMSELSILLTLVSILVAFSISLIEIMGLIGDECGSCQRAANAPDGGGLAGSWWRGWAKANDDSGYIGAVIVGGFVLLLVGWYGVRWALRWRLRKRGEVREGMN